MSIAPPLAAPNFDLAAAYPAVGALRAALVAGDWAAARALIADLDLAGRTALVMAGGETTGVAPLLRGALARDPDDTLAAAMLGHRLIKDGWEVRTAARAQDVSREQFVRFHEILREAEQVLIDAAARNPEEPSVWVERLITARGLQLGLSEVRRRYDRLARLDPHHLAGQTQLLQSLCPKWSGSWPQAHGFARECMLAAPEGSHNAVLVVDAHIEHWLELDPGDDARYVLSDPVRAEIHEAAARSVWHPDFRHDYGWVSVRSTFAMAFSMLDDQAAAAAQFAALGDLAAEYPWEYLGDPVEEISQRRARAFAKGTKK